LDYWKKHHSRPAQIGFRCVSLLHHAMRILRGMILYPLKPAEKQEIKFKIRRSLVCVSWLLHIPDKKIQLISG
jgi:hypothetical protein